MIKRLKIAEQILIILPIALIAPLVIAAAIIINTNQIAVRKELISSASIMTNAINNELLLLKNNENNNLKYSSQAINQMSSYRAKRDFIDDIKESDKNIISFLMTPVSADNSEKNSFEAIYIPAETAVAYSYIDNNNIMTTKKVSVNYITEHIFNSMNPESRQIYILDKNKKLLISKNYDADRFKDILATFPETRAGIEVFGSLKNQPNVMLYSSDYDWYIIVASPKELTDYGIVEARRKIIFSICLAAALVFFFFGIYTLYLYTNIRQFFKVIRAIADGNYTRKLRFIVSAFTAQELIFIADEFNKMIEKIDESYRELNESNIKLKKLDEYKSNLIDTVSHEFRTPLTSIKGYSSSLLRHDIQLDPETRKKSLKIIKNQAERLSRMVEDLLVIPDIESSTIRMNFKEVSLKNVMETSILSTSKADLSIFNVNMPENISTIYCDEDRLIQILINLMENALKYSKEDTMVNINVLQDNDFITIKIQNETQEILSDEILNTLFEKFARVDNNLTRTTRGTGLGLFIVKGLVETMGGKISLNGQNGFEVIFTIPVYKGQNINNE